MMLQMSDVREGGRFLGVGGFWVVGLIPGRGGSIPPPPRRETLEAQLISLPIDWCILVTPRRHQPQGALQMHWQLYPAGEAERLRQLGGMEMMIPPLQRPLGKHNSRVLLPKPAISNVGQTKR
jgi:hypothetical protein